MTENKLTGNFTVQNLGDKIFCGEYFESEILNPANKYHEIPELYQNHGCSSEEISNMRQWLDILCTMLSDNGIQQGNSQSEIINAQERLGVVIPDELITFYSAAGKNVLLTRNSSKKNNDYYLKLEDIYLEDNIIVFRESGKRKKDYLGISIPKRQLMIKTGDEWYFEPCMESFCESVIETVTIIAISNMKSSATGRLKGALVTSLQAKELAIRKFSDTFKPLETYYNQFHAIFYNSETKCLGWFRSNGFIADILVGAQDKSFIQKFGETHGNIKFSFT